MLVLQLWYSNDAYCKTLPISSKVDIELEKARNSLFAKHCQMPAHRVALTRTTFHCHRTNRMVWVNGKGWHVERKMGMAHRRSLLTQAPRAVRLGRCLRQQKRYTDDLEARAAALIRMDRRVWTRKSKWVYINPWIGRWCNYDSTGYKIIHHTINN